MLPSLKGVTRSAVNGLFRSIQLCRAHSTKQFDQRIVDRYLNLPQGNTVLATYVWIDGTGTNLRCKTKTVSAYPKSPSDLSVWNFDGSSTGQASGHDSDVYIKPVAIYRDPFIPGNNCLVLCETLDSNERPLVSNKRNSCAKVMQSAKEVKPWFGIEQEYTLLDNDLYPFGWPKQGFPGPQGPYYCGVGTNKVFGRQVMDAHYKACIYAGLRIVGTNVEVMPAQFEFQIGPCEGVEAADQVWMARYILDRVAEEFGVVITLDPKPMMGDWNGTGGHCNFSTDSMRREGGIEKIKEAIERLSKEHDRHIKLYDPKGGEDNKRRLTGHHETASYLKFSSGVAHRGSSVRIPRQCSKEGKGYLEDRRPAANCDPYLVTEALMRTVVLQDWSS